MIGSIVMPRGAELGANQHDDNLRVLVQKGLGVSFLLTAGFFIGSWFFGGVVLETWLDRSYEQSHLILLILLGAQVVATPIHVLRGVLFGMGHVKVPALFYFVRSYFESRFDSHPDQAIRHRRRRVGHSHPNHPGGTVRHAAHTPCRYSGSRNRISSRAWVIPQVLPLAALWGYSFSVGVTFVISPSWIPVLLVAAGGGVVLGASWMASHHATKKWLPA